MALALSRDVGMGVTVHTDPLNVSVSGETGDPVSVPHVVLTVRRPGGPDVRSEQITGFAVAISATCLEIAVSAVRVADKLEASPQWPMLFKTADPKNLDVGNLIAQFVGEAPLLETPKKTSDVEGTVIREILQAVWERVQNAIKESLGVAELECHLVELDESEDYHEVRFPRYIASWKKHFGAHIPKLPA